MSTYPAIPAATAYEINAFAAASNGKLTPVSGSPFRVGYVGSMAVNAKYLFVSDTVYIYTFAIASDGAIKQVASINAQQFNSGQCGGPGACSSTKLAQTCMT
ncbi:MAG TPA: hypothetical protein VN948_01680 [Terriglobales bacterium]|nr:hypothetical protein [Terriglobales bacterium]